MKRRALFWTSIVTALSSATMSNIGLTSASGLVGTKCNKAGEARVTSAGVFGCVKRGKRGLRWRLIQPASKTIAPTTTTTPPNRCGTGSSGFSIALRGDRNWRKLDSKAIAVDSEGNVLLSGAFAGTQDFDPGANSMNLSSDQGYLFLLKLDRTGNLIWVRQFGGPEDRAARYYGLSPKIALDASGNVYVTGSFTAAADFDPGPGVAVLNPSGASGGNNPASSAWIAKFDSSGNLLWLRQLTGSREVWANSIALDPSGNPIISGRFNLTADFDPSENYFQLTALGTPGSGVNSSRNGDDAFLLKLDASGNFVWANRYGGTSADSFETLITNQLGAIFVSTLTGVSKLDPSGKMEWSRTFLTNSGIPSLGLDPLGNLHISGTFVGTIDLDPGTGVLSFKGRGADVFIVKLGSAGELIWAKTYGSESADYSASIAVDAAGNVYSTGNYTHTLDITTLTGPVRLSSPGGTRFDIQDRYMLRLDSAGNFIWAKSLVTVSYNSGAAIAVDNSGMVHLAGALSSDADLDLGPDQCKLGGANAVWIFLAKVSSLGLTN